MLSELSRKEIFFPGVFLATRLFLKAFSDGMGRDSSVGIATLYGLDGITVGARFSSPVQTGPGAQPAPCTMGTGSFPGVKRLGRGADHPPTPI